MKKIKIFLYIPLLILLLTTCSNTGIFYSLEKEEKILESNNLNNSANFENMVTAGGYYYGNGGLNIYYRSAAAGSSNDISPWDSIALPSGYTSDSTNTSMILHGADLYISRISDVFDDSSIKSGIYRLPGAKLSTPSTITSSDWTMIVETTTPVGSSTYTYSVFRLHYANGTANECLYINHITYDLSNSYDISPSIDDSLLYVTDNPSGIANDLITNTSNIVISSFFDVDSDSNILPVQIEKITSSGNDHYMILNGTTNGKVYYATDAAPGAISFSEITSSTLDDTRYVDIYEYASGEILASNTKGSIYISADSGANWTESSVKSGAYFNGFADISLIPATPNTVIVGTAGNISSSSNDGKGYYLIDMSAATIDWATADETFTNINNYNSTDLSDATINGFLFDSANSRLFSYTSGYGVWLNIVSGSTRTWTHE